MKGERRSSNGSNERIWLLHNGSLINKDLFQRRKWIKITIITRSFEITFEKLLLHEKEEMKKTQSEEPEVTGRKEMKMRKAR